MLNPRSILLVSHSAEAERRVRAALTSSDGTSDVAVIALASLDEAMTALYEHRPLCVVLWPSEITSDLRQGWRTLKVFAAEAATAVIAVGPLQLPTVEEALAGSVDEYLPESMVESALPARVQSLRSPAIPRREQPFRPRTVLLVDDDAMWRMRMGGILESAGHRVLYASQPLEVMEAMQGLRGPLPEICVVDPFGPGLEGLDTVREVRALPNGRRLPILLVSAMRRDAALLAALQSLEVHDLLDKSHAAFDAIVPIIQDYVSLAVRRLSPRISFLAFCRIKSGQTVERWDTGLVYNLSSGGAYIRTLAPLTEGTPVELELEWGTRHASLLKGEVAWTHPFDGHRPSHLPPGMGVHFEQLTDELRQRLDANLWSRPLLSAERLELGPTTPS